ncbi:MAG: TonB family protein [Gemmatimonadota bacterium]|nr:TonB family protein [Gemmatimonadota bacterium]
MIAAWMLSATLFTALLGGAALFAELALRGARRQTRGPWLLALGAGVVWPILTPALRSYLRNSPTLQDVVVNVPSVQVIPDALPVLSVGHWIDVALLSLWVAASVIALARLAHALVAIRAIRRASEPRMVDDVPVLITNSIGPAVIGVIQPRVLIPASLLELDQSLRRLVLRHEMEHCRAHDPVALTGSAIALALVPWNLPLWWVVRRYRLAIEVDCDARVLATEPNARQYGQLLMLMSQRPRGPMLAPMLVASNSHLERRVSAMIPVSSKGRRMRIAVALSGAIFIALAACSSRISDGIAGPKPEVARRGATADAEKPYLEYEIDKPARQIPGTGNIHYPDELRGARVEGEVLAQFVVGEDGLVDASTFKALKSDHDLFTSAVKTALVDMKFFPAEVKGHKVKQLIQQPFTFALATSKARSATSLPVVPGAVFSKARTTPAHQMPGTGNLRYPDELRHANVEGEVIAQFVVTEEGRYLDGSFKVIRSTDPRFSEAVVAALPNMRFEPAMSGGRAVRQMLEQPFTFSLSKR